MENTTQKTPTKRIMPIVAGVVILGLLYFIGTKIMYSLHNEDTENAQLESSISPIVSRISGYVTALKVAENQAVKKGDTLFIIDDRDLKLKLQQAEIALKSAEANVELVRANVATTGSAVITSHANVETTSAGVESANAGAESANASAESALAGVETANASISIANAGVETANGNVEAAKIKVWKATQDFNRYSDLLAKKSVTQQQFDNAKAEKEGAEAQLFVAEKQLNTAKKQVELAQKQAFVVQKQANVAQKQAEVAQKQANVSKKQTGTGKAQEEAAKIQQSAAGKQIGVAEVMIEQRRSEVDFAKLQLSYCYVLAPIDGFVSKKNIQLGQLVNAGSPLFSIVDESNIWVVANFKETQIAEMKVGDKVELKVDAFPKEKFEGEIQSISATTGAKFALLPPDNASGNFVKVVQRIPVKIVLKSKSEAGKQLRAGMNVKVVVPI